MALTMMVYQAFDREPIAEMPADDAAALERKLDVAAKAFADRDGWLPAHQRIAILRKVSALLERDRDRFAMMIAREGGKPLADAIV
jgi:acyl-CoA reductase-like NAD-dependent aldehyde dehydrogenase